MIFRANQNVEKAEDLPAGLREGLDQVLKWVEFKWTIMLVFVTPNLAFFMESKRWQKKGLQETDFGHFYGLEWMQGRYRTTGKSCSSA